MKLGVSYNVFDGEELLEGSIRYIRDQVDYISAVYQTSAWFGAKASDNLLKTLNHLLDKKYIDEICEYHSEIVIDEDATKAHMQQLDKRNVGLEMSKKNGCTHHMTIDVDEFYLPDQFRYMKNYMDTENFQACALQHLQYYKDSIYMIYPPEGEYIIGIFKIQDDMKFVYGAECPVPVDPSRKPEGENVRLAIFARSLIQMHHMSFVRKDIRTKLISSIAKNSINHNIDKIVNYYNNWKYPMQAMWAGGNLLDILKVERMFDVYGEQKA
jgi:hypothetical protein